MGVARFSVAGKKENLAQMLERYRILAEPKTVKTGLFYFTLYEDIKLYNKLKTMPDHPKDTGLLQESWVLPARLTDFYMGGGNMTKMELTSEFSQYKGSFVSGKFNVYVLNTATVGEQARRKHPGGPKRVKKFSGRHNLKRYLPFVDKRTRFYTKALRSIRQGIDKDWKEFVSQYLYSMGVKGI